MAKVAVRRSVVTPAPALLASLLAYWPLSEAGGQRYDLHANALHLSEVGTLGAATGLVYLNAAAYDMDTDHGLTRSLAQSALLNFDSTTPFTIAVWLYLTDNTGGPDSPDYYRTILSLNGGSSFGGGYHIQTTNGAQIYFAIGKTGGPPQYTWHTPHYLMLNQWSLFGLAYADGIFTAYLDASDASDNLGAYAFTAATSGAFYVGIKGGNAQVWDGRMGPLLVFNKALDASEFAWLYNAGAGRTYAALE